MKTYDIERFGGLIKEEPLTCIENQLLIPDTCVLEAVSPFLGYYHDEAMSKPLYLYLMLDDCNTYWPVTQAIAAAKAKLGFSFDAVFGEISFPDNARSFTIRVRDLQQYDQISELQKVLKVKGLKFRRKTRSLVGVKGLIRLEKFFYLDRTPAGFYIDKQQDHHGYFEVPDILPWENFARLTQEVKYEVNLLYFDAAQAYFMENGTIRHFVRIYREGLTEQKIAETAQRYRILYDRFKP
ncbi:hypothetical protein MASR2M12_05480 [Bacteroidales bacterium]